MNVRVPRWVWMLLLPLLLLAQPLPAGERPVYVDRMPDGATFSLYARRIEGDEVGKFFLDIKTGQLLFFDVNLFPLHVDFYEKVLLKHPLSRSEREAYYACYGYEKSTFIVGYLTHHLKDDTWDFSFWENDRITPQDIRRTHDALSRAFFIPDLPWRPESSRQEALLSQVGGLATVTNDVLYRRVEVQALNTGAAVGFLRVVPAGAAVDTLDFRRDEIVLLQEAYPDLSPVAGIITTTFSTPLSHVNLRAKSWGIPNAGVRDAAERWADLDGAPVVLTVDAVAPRLRLATPREVDLLLAEAGSARAVQVPPGDLSITELRPLALMHTRDVEAYGAKAANLGEVAGAELPGVHVPGGFGIPFHFYAEHMRRAGLDAQVDAMLADARWQEAPWRRDALLALQEAIRAAPLDPALLDAVWSRVEAHHPGQGMFVRSSTNAEDLPGFNGAGLYDTVPNVRDRAQMEAAILKVWASLWNLRAVEERALFGIDQRRVYAGILVQRGIGATAAGVLVTRNLYDPLDDHSFTINAKKGLGMKVVEGKVVPEQVIYDVKYPGARVISRSDEATMLVFDPAGGVREVPVPAGQPVLTEAAARRLSEVVVAIQAHFPHPGPLDVEWLLEGEKVWIVQVRPLVGG